jgi:O-antigen ligase
MFMNARYVISKLFFAGIAIPAFISLLFTSSRSGWIGFAFGLMVFVFLINKKIIPLLLVLGLVSIPFMPAFVYKRIQSITNLADTSIGYRFKLWKISGQVLQDYWPTGIGLGTDAYRNIVQNYYLGDINGARPPHSHNLFFQLWLETGIVGLLAFLGFVIRLCKESYSCIKASADKQLRRILAAAISAVTSLCVVGMFEYPWYDSRVMLFTWVVAGIAISAITLLRKDGAEVRMVESR